MLFFGGVSYGSKGTDKGVSEIIETEVTETYPVIELKETKSETMEQADEELVIYRTASFFEKIFTFFYDKGIGLMYRFVDLFFE